MPEASGPQASDHLFKIRLKPPEHLLSANMEVYSVPFKSLSLSYIDSSFRGAFSKDQLPRCHLVTPHCRMAHLRGLPSLGRDAACGFVAPTSA